VIPVVVGSSPISHPKNTGFPAIFFDRSLRQFRQIFDTLKRGASKQTATGQVAVLLQLTPTALAREAPSCRFGVYERQSVGPSLKRLGRRVQSQTTRIQDRQRDQWCSGNSNQRRTRHAFSMAFAMG
jgi:hypothetical protein